MRGRYASAATGIGLGAFALALDQLSKRLALGALDRHDGHIPLPGPVDLTLVVNHSNAFGVVPIYGEVTRWGLIVLGFAMAVLLVTVLVRKAWPMRFAASFGFILAGALGNALDRLFYGFVIDYIDASKIGFHWVFNLADVSIDLGVALFVWATLAPAPKANAT